MPLKVSHGIGAWIKDFKGSDAPQFKGKSDKERRDQAIAAYLSAKRTQKEGKEDPPFEGPYKKAGSKPSAVPGKFGIGPSTAKHLAKMGMKKAAEKKPVKESDAAWAAAKEKEKMDRLTPNDQDKIAKIRAMLAKEKKPVKEETTFEVEVDGLPTMYMKAKSPGAVKAELRKIVKQPSMIQSIERVTDAEVKKVFRNKAQGREEEEMDEGVQQALRKYVPGYAKHQLNKKMDAQKYAPGDSAKKTVDKDVNYYRYKKVADKLNKEEVEEGVKGYNPGWMLKADPKLGAAVKAKQDLAKKRQATYGKPEAGKSVKKEEVEQIDELSKSTLRSYIDKKSDDHVSNKNAVDDARDALRKHQRNKPSLDAPLKHQFDHNAKKRELERDVNVASRTATRSNVNLLKAKKRLNKEEVNEISGELAQRYHDKAVKAPRKADAKDPIGHVLKRFSGMQRAQDRVHRDAMKDINKRASDRLKGM